MTDRLLLLLPAVCDPGDATAQWWLVSNGRITASGIDARWLDLAVPPGGAPHIPVVAIAPPAAARIARPPVEGTTVRQQIGVAKAAVIAEAMADPATLHAVAGLFEERLTVALVANGQMVEWLDWLGRRGVDPLAIVPAGLLMPGGHGGGWSLLSLGAASMLGRDGLVVPDEAALRDALVGGDDVVALDPEAIEQRLLLLATTLPLDLRSGRFARRKLLVLDWQRVRELAALAALIPLLGLMLGLVMLVRLDQASERLERETAALAGKAVGREVGAGEAVTLLDTQIGTVAGAGGSPFQPLTAFYRQLQLVPGASASSVNWRADGTLLVTLVAPRRAEIDRIMLALQREGYRVTGVMRAGDGGLMTADLTLRSSQ